MRNLQAIFLTLALLFFLPSMANATGNDVSLKAITFQQGGEKGETVRFVLSGELQPKIGMLPGAHPRLVVNFYLTDCSKSVSRNMAVNGKVVKRIRVGIHNTDKPPFVSVVLDLAPGNAYHYVRAFEPKDHTLLITVLPKDKHEPVAQVKTRKPSQIAKGSVIKKKAEKPSSAIDKVIREEEAKKLAKRRTAAKKEMAAAKAQKVKEEGDKRVQNKVEAQKQADTTQKPAISESSNHKKRPFIHTVSFEKTTGKGEMVMFKLNDFFPPKVSGDEKGNPKVICDFDNARLDSQVKDLINCNGLFVKSVQITKKTNPDKVRVVLHLTPNKNYDLQQVYFKEDNLFVIIVNSQDVLHKDKAIPSAKI